MFTFLGVRFFTGSYTALLKKIQHQLFLKKRFYVCVTSIHGIVEAQKNNKFQNILNRALYTVPDGMPIVWAGKKQNKNTIRIYGPRLMEEVCYLAETQKYKIYLYGTTSKTLSLLKTRLKEKFPHLLIVGTHAPPFTLMSNELKQSTYKQINASRAHIVIVGLSTPKQEMWMYEARPYLRASMLIGVGAAFDFLSGTKRQAPVWIQQSGFEWLFRLLQEPRRLGKRYVMNNILFLWFVIRERIKKYVFKNQQARL